MKRAVRGAVILTLIALGGCARGAVAYGVCASRITPIASGYRSRDVPMSNLERSREAQDVSTMFASCAARTQAEHVRQNVDAGDALLAAAEYAHGAHESARASTLLRQAMGRLAAAAHSSARARALLERARREAAGSWRIPLD